MPKNDIEAFDYLISDKDTAVEIDYLTYALFAYKKKRWIDHFSEQNNGQAPTQSQIDGWITQLSDFDFAQMRNDAGDFFHVAAEEHLQDFIEHQKKKAVDESILAAVKAHTSWWKHLGIALLMAIVAPVMLGGVLFFASFFDKSVPIHVEFSQGKPPSEKP
jgi:hypothetical protein